MWLTEIEPGEIKTQIRNLDSKKASHIFGISAMFLKFAGNKIIQLFTFLMNQEEV